MIRHIVLTRFRPDVSEDTIAQIYAGLARLTATMPGANGFVGGRSQSPEQIERGYLHGFTMDFDTWSDLQSYSENEDHKALGGQIVAHAEGGLDGVLVLDIDCSVPG
ncbi:Dabb family protein [Marivita sp. S6314]|uniref:Dabb family protein n=1 Tax=Marivita sp. S6314 TaxID=2926406 RepID=UPI001FF3C54A|nr:Dabb family protein [Marivita sp. S6314]MCK0149323.1 Dabb family protein [Marivita sp. S6314]